MHTVASQPSVGPMLMFFLSTWPTRLRVATRTRAFLTTGKPWVFHPLPRSRLWFCFSIRSLSDGAAPSWRWLRGSGTGPLGLHTPGFTFLEARRSTKPESFLVYVLRAKICIWRLRHPSTHGLDWMRLPRTIGGWFTLAMALWFWASTLTLNNALSNRFSVNNYCI